MHDLDINSNQPINNHMGSRYKFIRDDGVYFLTFVLVDHVTILQHARYADIIIDNFEFYRKRYGLRVHYYVIMSTHLHAVVSCPENISNVIKYLKSYTAKEILKMLVRDGWDDILRVMEEEKRAHKKGRLHQVWEEGSHPQLIYTQKVLKQKVDYIHNNPVKSGAVNSPEEWYYSSMRNIAGLDNPFAIDPLEL